MPGAKTPVLHAFKNICVTLQDEPFSYEPESHGALHDTIEQRPLRGPSRLSAPLVVLLEQFLMKLEVNALGQIQSSTDCGAAMRVDTISVSLLLNRPDTERSSFLISPILCSGSRRKGLTVKCTSIPFFFTANSRCVDSSRMRIWCSCNEFQV